MRKLYKYLIVVAALLAFLLCSVLPVGAVSRYGTVTADKAHTFGLWTKPWDTIIIWDIETIYWKNRLQIRPHFVESTTHPHKTELSQFSFNSLYWSFDLSKSDFDFDPLYGYHIRFNLVNWFGRDYTDSYYYWKFGLYDYAGEGTTDDGLLVSGVRDGGSENGDLYSFDIYLDKEQLARYTNNFEFYFDITFSDHYVPATAEPYLSLSDITYSSLTAEEELIVDSGNQITASVEEATNTIIHGWTPDPEKPAGSESVDDMTDIEQEIMEGSQEGIDTGNNILSNVADYLENWEKGFIFVIGIFNLIFPNIWINSLIQIGLALGLIAFILNIVPSIARKISSGKKGGDK